MVVRELETRPNIDRPLVRRLIASQFPQWANLPITPVDPGGVDNRSYRLGHHLLVRLPSAGGYAQQVDKEHRWLPVLASQLPLPIPVPVEKGRPGQGYPFSWSVYEWIEGETASPERIDDLSAFATNLAGFLRALQQIDSTDGPLPGPHSFYRGAPLHVYDDETRKALKAIGDQIDNDRAVSVWELALHSTWQGRPVWFHGDVASGNLLVAGGRLAAVIDFGCSGVGDPACDMSIAWTLLADESRTAFRSSLEADAATWARGRGWALWKAVITLAKHIDINPTEEAAARGVLAEVLADDDD